MEPRAEPTNLTTEFLESQTVTLEWTVRNLKQLFESSKGDQKSHSIKSAAFGGGRWRVLFYPNSGHESGEYVSLYLSCEPTEGEREDAVNGEWRREGVYKFKLELRSIDGRATFSMKEAYNHEFSWKTANWGWAQFARRDAVYYALHPVRLQDSFVIVCQITDSPAPPTSTSNEVSAQDVSSARFAWLKLSSRPPPVAALTTLHVQAGAATPSETTSRDSNTEPPIDATLNGIVTSHLSPLEMHSLLVDWGCSNLTSRMDLQACSEYSINTGGFGDVHRGALIDGTKIAIKSIRPVSADGLSDGKYQKRTAKELYTWSKCRHPNIVQLLGFAEFRGRLAMISPWAENGNLTTFLSKNRSADRCALSVGVCAGLAYLHGRNVVHGDLKGANVLVSDSGIAMLADFGNATLTDPTIAFTTTGAADSFSLRWTAPELLSGTDRFSRAADVYALGMTILEILTGKPPFADATDRFVFTTVLYRKKTPNRPETEIPTQSVCGNLLWAMLTSCWVRKPGLRPTASKVRDLMNLVTPDTLVHIEAGPESEDES